MTTPLRELAAKVVVHTNQIPQVGLPAELLEYLQVLNGAPESIAQAVLLGDNYAEVSQVFLALPDDVETDPSQLLQLIDAYESLEGQFLVAQAAMQQAIAVATDVQDPAWRNYMLPHLAQTQQAVDNLGNTIQQELNELRAVVQDLVG